MTTSKSELKRKSTLDPVAMAERMYRLEQEVEMLKMAAATFERQRNDARNEVAKVREENLRLREREAQAIQHGIALEKEVERLTLYLQEYSKGVVPKTAHMELVGKVERLTRELDTEQAQYDCLRSRVFSLYEAIAHGDDEHRKWLKSKLEEHFLDHQALQPVEETK